MGDIKDVNGMIFTVGNGWNREGQQDLQQWCKQRQYGSLLDTLTPDVLYVGSIPN